MKHYKIVHLKRGSLFTEGTDTYVLNLLSHLKCEELASHLLILAKGPADQTPVVSRAHRLGIRCSVLECPHKFRIRYVRDVRTFLKTNQISLLHCHGYKDMIIGLLAARGIAVTKVTSVHGYTNASLKARIYERIEQALLPQFDHIITCTERMRRDLLTKGLSPEAVTTVYPGIEAPHACNLFDHTELRQRCGLTADEFVIGTVGRLSPEKGHSYLLDAFVRLLDEIPQARLLLVGDGKERTTLARRIATLGLERRISLLGELPREEVMNLYPLMDVFVLPSLHEQFPGSLLEAMAHRRPVIATSVGGIPEILDHGATGFLVPPRDAVSLAETILMLYKNESLRDRVGRDGQEHALTTFSAARFGKQMAMFYLQCLEGSVR